MKVFHFGNDPRGSGGIASVIRRHLQRTSFIDPLAITTYDQDAPSLLMRHKPAAAAGWRILTTRPTQDLSLHFHLSQRGSLLREGFLMYLARLRGHRGTVVTVHASGALDMGRMERAALRRVLRSAAVVHALSSKHAHELPAPAEKIVCIPNDVALPQWTPRRRTQDLLFAGVVGLRKGVDLLLTAWRMLDVDGWRLVICGPEDGTISADDREYLKTAQSVQWLGAVGHDQVLEHMARASALILPSRAEALPMSVCEAMAHGLPVIASDVGGTAELLGADNPYLIEAGSLPALEAALGRLMARPEERASAGQRNRHRAEQLFAPSCIEQQWTDIYGRPRRNVGRGRGGEAK